MDKAMRAERLRRLALAAAAAERAAADAIEARNAEIEAAEHDDQWPLPQIADHTGLHRATVHRIVAARTAARQARTAQLLGLQ